MRFTVEHGKTKAEMKEKVDQTFDKVFQGIEGMPVQIEMGPRSWQGDVMGFALTAKMGFFSAPIKGTVTVDDQDLTVEVDLGMLSNFVSDQKVEEMIGGRIRGLLK